MIDQLQLKLCFTFAYAYATIRIGIPLKLLPRPAGNSSTEELNLYNPLKHSLVLSIGYAYSALSIDCTSFVNLVCFREPTF